MMRERRPHHDVTNTVLLSDPLQVERAVAALMTSVHPEADLALLHAGFDTFTRLFRGELPGYHACDTPYHNLNHSLDVTLAYARLVAGHEHSHRQGGQLGAERSMLGVIIALFHDSGYVRRLNDTRHKHGAEYTFGHVRRSGRFIRTFLDEHGWGHLATVAAKIVHFTGYEMAIEHIALRHPHDRMLGHLLGTADLLAQMADRTYLEKCRDFLYDEFEKGGITRRTLPDGSEAVIYASPEDLLRKTPQFYEEMVKKRLEQQLGGAYRYAAAYFDGEDLYQANVKQNLYYLKDLLKKDGLEQLRRTSHLEEGPRLARA